jgi:carbonic anhydrase/acetyltransferase-like protein (isoleucine patch superfamily)
MIKSFKGKTPQIAPSALIHDSAFVIGDVAMGEGSSAWPGAVIRGDIGPLRIGKNVHMQDNCIMHTEFGCEIADNVVIGHAVVVHCEKVDHHVLVGNNATLLDDAVIGEYCIIGAGSVVSPGMKIPPRSLVMGNPARVKGEITQKHLEQIEYAIKFYANKVAEYKAEGY